MNRPMTINPTDLRIGQGYDVHAFAPDRKLILGNAVLRPFFFKIVYPIGIVQLKSLQSKKECDIYRFCHTPLNV